MPVAGDLAGGPARRVRASGWSRPGTLACVLAREPRSRQGELVYANRGDWRGVAGVPPCGPPGPAPRGRTRGAADAELILAPPPMGRPPAGLITETKAAGAGGRDRP